MISATHLYLNSVTWHRVNIHKIIINRRWWLSAVAPFKCWLMWQSEHVYLLNTPLRITIPSVLTVVLKLDVYWINPVLLKKDYEYAFPAPQPNHIPWGLFFSSLSSCKCNCYCGCHVTELYMNVWPSKHPHYASLEMSKDMTPYFWFASWRYKTEAEQMKWSWSRLVYGWRMTSRHNGYFVLTTCGRIHICKMH